MIASEEMNMPEQLAAAQCSICLGDIDDPVNLCVDDHESCCRDCASGYIDSQVCSAFFGSCPSITCPSLTHQKAKQKKVILYNRWSPIVQKETAAKYKALASHLLAFLCGGCHTLKTLDVGFEPDQSAECYGKVQKLLTDEEGNAEKYAILRSDISTFCLGEVQLEEFYNSLTKNYFPRLNSATDYEAWEIFLPLLKTIEEPERRCNLHLRYLRDRPRMKTLCCNREHCFRCKIKDFHDGKSCVEYSSNLDNSIVTCPSCGIALARGDGCNTITCVCGKQFSWSQEKENTERSFAFRDAHPENTSETCADILCTKAIPSSASSTFIMQAKAWQIRNRIEVNRALRGWFKRTYSPYPSQMCAKLVPEGQPDGVREAMDLWRTDYGKQVAHCKSQNEIAIASVFTTAYPIAAERPVAAHILVSLLSTYSTGDSILSKSASKWIESHKEEYKRGVEQWELRSARQFVFLHGRQNLSRFKSAHQNIYCAQVFNRSISNSELAYTCNDMSVQRPGSASCYPAAFADLTNERCMFRVRIDEAPRSSNWLTFGLARRGMANSSSDGVGRTSNTWGLSDDRSSGSSQTSVSSCGSEATQFRKLAPQDVLTAIVDVHEGWLELSLNETEAVHRMSIPAGSVSDYVFAMTFANDHRVTIIADAPLTMMPLSSSSTSTTSSTAPEHDVTYLNSDHSCMLNNFKKQLKLILTESNETNFTTCDNSELITDGTAWFQLCGSDRKVARDRVELLLPAVQSLLHIRRQSSSASTKDTESETALSSLPVTMLLDALSWYRINRDRIYQDRKGEMAMNFSLIHGDSAPFVAAMTASQSQISSSSVAKEEVQAAIAYMHYFSAEMQEWYDLDALSGDPLVEHVAKECRCLPRHLRTCPVVNKQSGR